MTKKFVMLVALLCMVVSLADVRAEDNTVLNPNFKQVTSKLNPGGTFYLYLSSEDAFKMMDEKLLGIKDSLLQGAMPVEQKDKVGKAFDLASKFLNGSGLKDIKGIGASSLATKDKFFHNRVVFYHEKGQNKGMLWKVFGNKEHSLETLKLLPKDTLGAAVNDINAGVLWSWIKQNIAESGLPELRKGVIEFERDLKQKQNIDLNQLLGSFHRWGIILTADPGKQTMIPANPPIPIPAPSLALIAYTNNDYLFNTLKSKIRCIPHKNNVDGVEKYLLQVPPMPLPFSFKPTLLKTDKFIVLASNEKIINDMLATQKNGNGLVAGNAFKKLSGKMPESGNGFKYISPKLTEILTGIQKMAMKTLPTEQRAVIDNLDMFTTVPTLFGVFQNTDEGYVISANANVNLGSLVTMQATIAPTAIMAGMLLPALNSAREKARRISCASNLKQLGLSLKMYAMDHDDKYPVANGAKGLNDLRPDGYLSDAKLLTCPSTETGAAQANSPFTEETLSYYYLGGFTEMDPPSLPIAFDKVGNHQKYVNILFNDGHVKGCVMPNTSPSGVVEYIIQQNRFSPAICKKLRTKAAELTK